MELDPLCSRIRNATPSSAFYENAYTPTGRGKLKLAVWSTEASPPAHPNEDRKHCAGLTINPARMNEARTLCQHDILDDDAFQTRFHQNERIRNYKAVALSLTPWLLIN